TERGTALEKSLRNQAGARGFSVVQVSDRELADCASTDTPQGIIGIAVQPERAFDETDSAGLLLLLDGVQDPGNVGTILRTAQAFGVTVTIALPGTVDLWNPKVVRAAMGALFTHRAFHADVEQALKFVRDGSMQLWATAADGESVTSHAGSRAGKGLAIVVGNEGHGVSPQIVAAADRTVAIPVRGVESLNVAVATGILLHAVSTE
ncbi:MAG: RNA methyltransferase, partial [Gemmatimonadaceae bacterium]